MYDDIQKGGVMKRLAAAMLDVILVIVLATGAVSLVATALDYNSYNTQMEQITQSYVEQFGLDTEMTQEKFDALTQQEQDAYLDSVKAADQALAADEEAVALYRKIVTMILTMVTLSVLAAMLILEFVVPLLFKNGQTLGKKMFGLGLMRNDGVKLSTLQLFVRTLLGKYAVGTMIPVFTAIMYFLGALNTAVLLLFTALVLGQLICVAATRNNCTLEDLMAGTVVVDLASQNIFESPEAREAYVKKLAAERAARQTY